MTRQGLKRLECPEGCGPILYATLAQLERYGLPNGPCGHRMVPEDLEVAAHILDRSELASPPAWREFEREASSILHGQASHVQRGRDVMPAETLAAQRVRDATRAVAHARRISGLVNVGVSADPMPF